MGAAASSARAQMQTDQGNAMNNAFPWWVRFLARGLGVLGGFVAIFFAVIGLVSIHAQPLIAVILQLFFGMLVIALEAPFCCSFIEFIDRIAKFSESRKDWHKGVIYCLMGCIPIIVYTETETVLGSGMIFACGVAYGFMALGRKADLSSMGGGGTDPAWNATINQQVPASFSNPNMA
ncbi:hypothetical protein AB6A40_003004 [Gnathostoma spinigerum]|uniref:Calcium channel flower n=1 Tax=Gnathostoma spinigerum TaxID=75299 RepID=A0ABD6E888_9BILA